MGYFPLDLAVLRKMAFNQYDLPLTCCGGVYSWVANRSQGGWDLGGAKVDICPA